MTFAPLALRPDSEIIADLANHLDGALPQLDPCDPDACFKHLADLEVERPSIIAKHLDAAIKVYGQRLIDRAMINRSAA
jgi:hypothetical protein